MEDIEWKDEHGGALSKNEDYEWEDEDWDAIINSIEQKKCILMLGPDASTGKMGDQFLPLTMILADQLATKIDPQIKKKINTSDLTQVGQYYCMEKGRFKLEAQVSSFFNKWKNAPSDLYKNLAALPFYFIITSTPDNMLRSALKNEYVKVEDEYVKKDPIAKWYNFKGENPANIKMGTKERPLLFYLYGSLEKVESLLLTENDLLDFLVALISKRRPLADNILSELQDKDKCFLFLGFGFRHWYLRILLYVLQGGHKNPSFAMEQFTPPPSPQLQQNIIFFQKSEFKIHILNSNLNDFVRELKRRFEQRRETPLEDESLPPIDKKAPKVFICHASEDKDYADFLYKELEKAGLRAWLDKKSLRGGDDWDNRIIRTIKEIDYFVVLQSKALKDKKIGYVNREIYEALSRQKEHRNIRFVIPAKIEKCVSLENLEHLQTIDLTDRGNIKELLDIINSDFKTRRKQ